MSSEHEHIVIGQSPVGMQRLKQTNKRAFLWSFSILLFLFNFGFDALISSLATAYPQFREQFGSLYDGKYVVSATWQSLWSAGNLLGAIIGNFLAGATVDRFGRKFCFWAILITSVVASIALILASSVKVLLAAKLVFGATSGLSYTAAPLYATENSPAPIRGLLMSCFNLFVVIGQFVSVLRDAFAITFLVPAILLPVICFLPESPVFLVMKGREGEAIRAIKRFYGPHHEQTPSEVMAQIKINLLTTHETTTISHWLQLFSHQHILRTLVSVVLAVNVNTIGTSFVIGYQTYYYELAGVANSFAITCGAFAIMTVGSITAISCADLLGNRIIVVGGGSLLPLWNLLAGSCGFADASNRAALIITVVLIASWSFIYHLSLGTVSYIALAEIPTQRLRPQTQALSAIMANVFGFGISFSIPYLFNPDKANLGSKIMLIYFGISLPLVAFLYFFMPETRNMTFEMIDQLYASNLSPRKFASTFVGNDVTEISLTVPIYYEFYDVLHDAAERKEDFADIDEDIASAVRESINKYTKYYTFMDISDTYYTALILDPRIKADLIGRRGDTGRNILNVLLDNLHEKYPKTTDQHTMAEAPEHSHKKQTVGSWMLNRNFDDIRVDAIDMEDPNWLFE
ncbi:sugar transporter, putative [Talaromyces stipitatus ATCC 10500]|uniref:Sugar transporter, putative n=1 Tax=Talaromyces stipitatus (strain ATCC 10500 / CBS 375.48 / QM 6759 / NRRL 1006) TaxID=441959 RepID=B8LVN2_TALSN|nr:sugar transporter, putative [Talaromyces stipitatus ATCC 10500]EED24162.1 sugar transporter, putative [Talaromyces stipitatus ATCC 10500]